MAERGGGGASGLFRAELATLEERIRRAAKNPEQFSNSIRKPHRLESIQMRIERVEAKSSTCWRDSFSSSGVDGGGGRGGGVRKKDRAIDR